MTPIGTGQAPAPLTRAEPAQVMIDRLVCGDGGNPDPHPTRTRPRASGWSRPSGHGPHHNSHDALDQGADVQEEVRNAGRAVVVGELSRPK